MTVKLLGLSPSADAVHWVLYDRTYDRVFLAGVARFEGDDLGGRMFALESWILQVMDQYGRTPGIQEVVLEQQTDVRHMPLPQFMGVLRRRCQPWQVKVTEIPAHTIRTRVMGDATSQALVDFLRPRYRAVLEKLDVAEALAAVLAWTPTRFSLFGRR